MGSAVKVITGNLDQTDAAKYDKSIETIMHNESEMKRLMNDQISLLDNSILKFKNITNSLAHNQLVLESRVHQIEGIIKATDLHDIEHSQSMIY